MDVSIRNMELSDKETVLEMMRGFYSSPAVSTDGSEEIFLNDIDNCINNKTYAEGFVFENGDDLLGYAMIAKSYSTEFGKRCIWIEDLFIREAYRGLGIGKRFFELIFERFPDSIYRLEVEEENEGAIALYEKCGLTYLPYLEMIRNP